MIIGELLNSSRKAIYPLIDEYNTAEIIAIAKAQQEAGADYLDLNCGVFVDDEPQRLVWLLNVVQDKVDLPLCFDSPSAVALAAALAAYKGGKKPLINSISGESQRFTAVLPLVLQYNTKVIALCMDDEGIPPTAEARLKVADKLYDQLTAAGVDEDDIYFDPLVQPVSTDDQAALAVLATVRAIRQRYPKAHTACGLSNVSFGLPNRKLINRYFVAQLLACDMDSFILNPLDKPIMGLITATKMLLGQDAYCGKYLKAHRKGLFVDEG